MEALRASSFPSTNIPKALHEYRTHFTTKPNFMMNFQTSSPIPSWSFSSSTYNKKNTSRPFKVFTISSPPPSSSTVSTENAPPPPEPELETDNKEEKFDWFSEWYPVMPVCDLDKRVPHGKKVLGIDIVVGFGQTLILNTKTSLQNHLSFLKWTTHHFLNFGSTEIFLMVSPGNSRLIWGFAKNFGSWIDNIIPRWILHIKTNIVVDSELHLLHIEEQKIMEVGPANWHKACFVPTKSDAFVVGFRRWLNKYSDGQINWGAGKFSSGTLPPTPPRQQLMDRSCNRAYKSLNAVEVVLQVISFVSIGIAAATKQSAIQATARTAMVSMAVIGFAASRWLAHFIYKNFHYHDYDHTLH
ncbi:hypothetical protein ACOSQ3_017779 [Xanthoceras sorbifolium]